MLNALIIIMVFATIVYEVSEILVYELDFSIRMASGRTSLCLCKCHDFYSNAFIL